QRARPGVRLVVARAVAGVPQEVRELLVRGGELTLQALLLGEELRGELLDLAQGPGVLPVAHGEGLDVLREVREAVAHGRPGRGGELGHVAPPSSSHARVDAAAGTHNTPRRSAGAEKAGARRTGRCRTVDAGARGRERGRS